MLDNKVLDLFTIIIFIKFPYWNNPYTPFLLKAENFGWRFGLAFFLVFYTLLWRFWQILIVLILNVCFFQKKKKGVYPNEAFQWLENTERNLMKLKTNKALASKMMH